MTVLVLWNGKQKFNVTGAGINADGKILKNDSGEEGTEDEIGELIRAAALCNDATLHNKDGHWKAVGDPTEVALIAVAGKFGINEDELRSKWRRLDELPFDSAKKIMATLHQSPSGEKIIYLKGAPESVVPLLLNSENSVISISLYHNKGITSQWISNTSGLISRIIPNIIAYGASRLQIEAPETMFEYNKKRSPIYSLFHTEGVLQNIEYWLLNKANKKQQAQVKDLLVKIMPHIDNIKINGQSIIYTENGLSVDVTKLSAGHKSVLAMIGDMLIRLYEQQPSAPSPSDLSAASFWRAPRASRK